MVDFILSPTWFYGVDVVFEAVTMAVAAVISLYSYRIFKFSQIKRYFWFSISFAMLSASFIAKILTNITVYYNVIERHSLGLTDVAVRMVHGSDVFFVWGFIAYRLLTLIAFLGIYLVMTTKVKTSRSAIALLVYFTFALIYFSKKVALSFHITAALLLFFIFMFTFRNCYRNINGKTACVSLSFFIIILSQIIFIPSLYGNTFAYVVAEVTQLLGYSSMLMAYVMVRKSVKIEHGVKKN